MSMYSTTASLLSVTYRGSYRIFLLGGGEREGIDSRCVAIRYTNNITDWLNTSAICYTLLDICSSCNDW